MRRLIFCIAVCLVLISGEAYSQEIMTVEKALEVAVNNYPGIKAIREETTIKDMEKKEAIIRMLPKVKLTYSYYRLNEVPALQIGEDLYLPVLNDPTPPRFDDNGNIALDWDTRRPLYAYIPDQGFTVGTQDNHALQFEVTQVLFAGGSLYQSYQMAKNNIETSDLETQKAVRELKVKVIEAYYGVIASRQGIDVAKGAVASVQGHLNQAMAFYKAGVIAKNDVLQAQVKLAQSEQNLITVENLASKAESGLNVTLARPISEPVIIDNDIQTPLIEESLEEAIDISKKNRQEIKQLDIYMDTTMKAVKAAKGGYAPRVAASYIYKRSGPDINIKDDQWSIGVGLEWTLFGQLQEGGTAYTNVEKARAKQSQVLLEKQRKTEEVTLEVKDAYQTAAASKAKMEVGIKAIDQAEENLRIQKHRYNLQACTSFDVLDAQTMVDKAKIDYISARAEYAQSVAKLKAAMGIL
jgi:outer membrane protein